MNEQNSQLMRSLEIIAGVIPPPPQELGDVPTHHFHRIKTLAAMALRDPDNFDLYVERLKNQGWIIPLPFHVEFVKKQSESEGI